MSSSDIALAALAVAYCNLLAYCLTVSRRLGRIERTTKTDPRTGLGSGHWLESERWPAALRSGRPLGVVYIDLDLLKSRNDRLATRQGISISRTPPMRCGKARGAAWTRFFASTRPAMSSRSCCMDRWTRTDSPRLC